MNETNTRKRGWGRTGCLGVAAVVLIVVAAPRRVSLNLRGAWQRDADVYIEGKAAGGSVWLPPDMRIEGLDRPPTRPGLVPEIEPLTLRLNMDTPRKQVILID